MIQARTSTEFLPLVLNMPSTVQMNADQFYTFCQANPDLWMERTAEGQIVLLPPRDGMTSNRNARLVACLDGWADVDGTGVVFECSGTFVLPNKAIRSPDASWVRRSRLAGLTAEQKEKFLPLCPDFVIELRSPSDSLSDLKKKMEEYIANGTELGWLINPRRREVFVYRPGQAVLHLQNPETVSGDRCCPASPLTCARFGSRASEQEQSNQTAAMLRMYLWAGRLCGLSSPL